MRSMRNFWPETPNILILTGAGISQEFRPCDFPRRRWDLGGRKPVQNVEVLAGRPYAFSISEKDVQVTPSGLTQS